MIYLKATDDMPEHTYPEMAAKIQAVKEAYPKPQ
jgi:hypothetical protein